MDRPSRILLIRPSALGDVCRTVPVLASLKRWAPDARIDWLVHDAYTPAVANHPDLHRAVPFPRQRLAPWWRSPSTALGLRRWLRSLRDERYDMVVDCQGLFRSGYFAWCTRAPRRVGYANAQELGWLGVNRRHHVPRDAHTVDRMLALIEREGVPPVHDMRLYTADADRAALDARLRGVRFALLAPASKWEGKRWRDERFAALAQSLLDDGASDAVAVVGSAGERAQCPRTLDACERDPRMVDLMGRTSVGGLMAAVEAAALVVANDSAPLHMAVGFDRPYVALFGPTRTELVGPYGGRGVVLQRTEPADRLDHKSAAAGRALMDRISLEDARAACRHALTLHDLNAPAGVRVNKTGATA